MSHLLYLHALDWPSYEDVFVKPKKATIAAVVARVNLPHLQKWVLPKLTAEKLAAFAPRVLGGGANRAKLSGDDGKLFDVIVEAAFHAKKVGIKTKPISPMGIGAPLLDEIAPAFTDKKAKALLATLRAERFVLAPAAVVDACRTLASIEVDDDEDLFATELVAPFAAVVKKKQGLRGAWM